MKFSMFVAHYVLYKPTSLLDMDEALPYYKHFMEDIQWIFPLGFVQADYTASKLTVWHNRNNFIFLFINQNTE